MEWLPEQRWLYAQPEVIPDPHGIVCSQWIITLRVRLNAEDVSTEQQAGSVGSCL